VQHFYIDHLTALAATQDDERKALEVIMADVGGLVKELGVAVYLISHLATPEGKPHEEGGRVTIRHFKGSRSIGFWCHYIFGLERNQQDDDPIMAITTTFRCLKDRYTGRATGKTFYMRYDRTTALLDEVDISVEEAGKQFMDAPDTPMETHSDF
jgi:twinkle protein